MRKPERSSSTTTYTCYFCRTFALLTTMHFSNTLESLIPAFEPRHGGNSRFPIAGTFVLGVFLALTPAQADAYAPKDGAATRHRVAANAGFGLVINAAGIDGRYENSKVGP